MRTIIFLPWFALFLWVITLNNCFFYAKCCRVVCLFTIALLLFQVIDLKSKTVKSYDSMGQRHDDICSLLLLVFFLHLSFYLSFIFWHYLFLYLHIYDEFQVQRCINMSHNLVSAYFMKHERFHKKIHFFMLCWCKMNFNLVFAFF